MGCGSSVDTGNSSNQIDIVDFNNFIKIHDSKVQFSEFYLKGKLLGEGTYGQVYRCKHKNTNKIYALKQIAFEGLTNDERNNNLCTDIQILLKLDHPNIIKIHEVFKDELRLYVISEYIEGGELLQRIEQKGYLDEIECANVVKQILQATYYAHLQGVAHRDIKLENVVLTEQTDISKTDYKIKLIDWGCAGFLDAGKKFTVLVGSPLYVAPEVLKKKYGLECDLWSIGVLTYILLSSSPPFVGRTMDEIFDKIKMGMYDFTGGHWKSISQDAKDFIKKLIVKDPYSRLSAKKALEHSWLKINKKEEISEDQLQTFKKNFQKYNSRNKFQKATLSYISHLFLTSAQKKEYEKIFTSIDTNNNGVLSQAELCEIYTKDTEDQTEATKELENLIQNIDINENKKVSYSEFLALFIKQDQLENEKLLKQAYDSFDTDGSGQIDIVEFQSVFGDSIKEQKNQKEWKELLARFDTDKNQKISFEEFKNLVNDVYIKPK